MTTAESVNDYENKVHKVQMKGITIPHTDKVRVLVSNTGNVFENINESRLH